MTYAERLAEIEQLIKGYPKNSYHGPQPKVPDFDWKKFGQAGKFKGKKFSQESKPNSSINNAFKFRGNDISTKFLDKREKTFLTELAKKEKLSSKQKRTQKNILRQGFFRVLSFKKKQVLTKKLITKNVKQFFVIQRPQRKIKNKFLVFSVNLQKKIEEKKKKVKHRIIKINRRIKFQQVKPKLKQFKIRKYFFREKTILLDLILTTNFVLGRVQKKKQIKNDLIRNYMIAIRNEHALYNMNMLLIQLRRSFHLISNIYFYKQLIMLNLISIPKMLPQHIQQHITQMGRPTFLVAQKKWIGGALTNYKNIYKQLYSNLNKRKTRRENLSFLHNRIEMQGLKLPRPPRLPSLLFSIGECHWALNEAKKLKLKTVQCVETSHTTYFGEINIAMNTSQFSVIILVSLLKEACIFANLSFKLFTKNALGKKKFFIAGRKQIKNSSINKFK